MVNLAKKLRDYGKVK